MVKCHLSRLMGERRVNVSELASATGLNRNTVTLLYHEKAKRVDLEAIEKICTYLNCSVADLFEVIRD